MNAGITLDAECEQIWETQLKVNTKYQGMVLKFDGKENFVLDKILEKGFKLEELAMDHSYLPEKEARFVVFDVPSCNPNSKTSKFVLFSWIPSSLLSKEKFPFASSIGAIKSKLGVTKDFNFDDLSGFDHESICKDLRI